MAKKMTIMVLDCETKARIYILKGIIFLRTVLLIRV